VKRIGLEVGRRSWRGTDSRGLTDEIGSGEARPGPFAIGGAMGEAKFVAAVEPHRGQRQPAGKIARVEIGAEIGEDILTQDGIVFLPFRNREASHQVVRLGGRLGQLPIQTSTPGATLPAPQGWLGEVVDCLSEAVVGNPGDAAAEGNRRPTEARAILSPGGGGRLLQVLIVEAGDELCRVLDEGTAHDRSGLDRRDGGVGRVVFSREGLFPAESDVGLEAESIASSPAVTAQCSSRPPAPFSIETVLDNLSLLEHAAEIHRAADRLGRQTGVTEPKAWEPVHVNLAL